MAMISSLNTISASEITPITGPIRAVTLQNTHASAIIYIGDPNVSSTAYGLRLNPGVTIQLTNVLGYLYGIASATAVLAKIESR